jgi:hypothetical protein
LPGRVLLDLTLPADSLLPGVVPAHDASCPAIGKRVISAPVSAMMTSAVRVLMQLDHVDRMPRRAKARVFRPVLRRCRGRLQRRLRPPRHRGLDRTLPLSGLRRICRGASRSLEICCGVASISRMRVLSSVWTVDDDQFLRWSMTTGPPPGIRAVSDGITNHAPQLGSPPPAERKRKCKRNCSQQSVVAR